MRSIAEKADWRRKASFEHLGLKQGPLLARGQGVLADDPRHPLEPCLFPEQCEEALAQRPPAVGALSGPEGAEARGVFRLGHQRVHGRIEAGLRTLHIERPEGART